ncbi:ABC transporter ATP-binding protein/permease [Clostridium estertheticum]|uniref:ABC transporter ATP-binding protein n=1 Tax=Clostridium estertheticum TaxID=238834 RepID=UPI001CF57A9D|nr:ABC transporter ATP-binding protein [Clostridium estertheticum]MCB2308296.1 ABC transporter ATP-binding protein/permease [Clostridium estertheticum]MCB2346509.1 ABC transporter ATP-binding protein/permease [Clostridium estertheticum]MCB2349477.1 ABC transporter ATP-binding protein/permease [Clostridium estertheticum]WAG47888.1 ABC transporter ATP-binding protein/permease [Clostridium estertheticum]
MGKISSLLKLTPFIKKHRLVFIAGIIGMLLGSIIATPIPYIIGIIMDKVLIAKKGYNQLYYYIGIIAVFYVLRYFISILSNYMFVKINNLVVNELRCTVMDKVMELPMNYLANTEKGYVQSRIAECSTVGSIFSPSYVGIVLSLTDAVLALVTMFAINYKLSIVILILTPLFFFSSKMSMGNFMKNTKEMLEYNATLNGECFEIINGIEDIKILNGKSNHLKKFNDKLSKLVKSSLKQSKSMIIFMGNITFINNFGSLLVLLIAGILILKGEFTVGLYTSFSLYITKVFSSIQGIGTMGTMIKPVCLSIERVYELLDMDDENSGKDKNLNEEIKSIKLENVTFKYKNNTKNVLNGINFEIIKGEKVLIKGENGSGKSTIIKLLLGLYNPVEGRILCNNIDMSMINTKSLRGRIGIVSQSIFLFKGTVLANILYGQTKKKLKDVEELIKKLGLQEYINKLPKGLDTEITQNNSGISGGQAQVIAFIRVILSNKNVIILDEPISNVDVETRDLILGILRDKDFDGTLIVVSHVIEGMDFLNRIIEI